jgi:ribosomal protein S11
MSAYQAELNEKVETLQHLLNSFDDGRRKNVFCLAANLLEITDINDVTAWLQAMKADRLLVILIRN